MKPISSNIVDDNIDSPIDIIKRDGLWELLKFFFVIEGRVSRKQFFLHTISHLISYLLFFVVPALGLIYILDLYFPNIYLPTRTIGSLIPILWGLLLVPLCIRRSKDACIKPISVILLFIPYTTLICILFLCFTPSRKEVKGYSVKEKTKNDTSYRKSLKLLQLLLILTFVFILIVLGYKQWSKDSNIVHNGVDQLMPIEDVYTLVDKDKEILNRLQYSLLVELNNHPGYRTVGWKIDIEPIEPGILDSDSRINFNINATGVTTEIMDLARKALSGSGLKGQYKIELTPFDSEKKLNSFN